MSSASSHPQESTSPAVALVFAYYENPGMLEFQWEQMAKYPEEIKAAIEVIVVDDASQRHPAHEVVRPSELPSVSIFRIDQDVRWNQDAARNIGAHEARSPWLLLTDIDHVVPANSLRALIGVARDEKNIYSLGRTKFFGTHPQEPHPNSYLMTKNMYWSIGGHDEDFAGLYGKDFLFRKRAMKIAREVHLPDVVLARVGTTAIKDAGTTTIARTNTRWQQIWGYLLEGLKALRLWRGVQTLKHPYRRML